MIEKILDEPRRELLREERRVLQELIALLARLDSAAPDQEALRRSLEQLDELFLLVVVGEFNAGKSAVINALVGERVVEEGVTPTTSRIGLLRHGSVAAREVRGAGLEAITASSELLRDICIVDTPGTNAVLRAHEALTRDFVPRSDLVLFVTSADRPFTESERAFLETIRAWGKRVVVVVNKIDILERPEDVAAVVGFVEGQALALLGARPEVFAVSARQALRAKAEPGKGALDASGFGELEGFLTRRLGEAERVRLKLLNPLGVGLLARARAERVVDERRALIQDDVATLLSIDAQLSLYREDLARDFRFRLADVENILFDFEKRGRVFLEETLRVGRIFDLMKRERIRDEFERKVVADLPQVVERRVSEIVAWLVASELTQWQGIMERLQRRQAAHAERMLGQVKGSFDSDRARLLDEVRREAQRAVESYDHQAEARRLAQAVRDTVAGTALLQVSALGLGAVVAVLATSTFADVTGIVAAGALSALGLLLLPARRRKALGELHSKVAATREKLLAALTSSFEGELQESRQRVVEAMGPYSRFVRAEDAGLRDERAALATLGDQLEALKARIEAL